MLSFLTALSMALAQPAPLPACTGAPYGDFDFWVGSWNVFDEEGRLAGRNTIVKEEDGCLLVERWSSAAGGTGQSYNYVDPATGLWRQIWVSRAATIDYSGGLDDSGSMVLEGTIAYRARPGSTRDFKGRWTPREDGSVKQSFHERDPGTGEWKPWFTGIYERAGPKDAP